MPLFSRKKKTTETTRTRRAPRKPSMSDVTSTVGHVKSASSPKLVGPQEEVSKILEGDVVEMRKITPSPTPVVMAKPDIVQKSPTSMPNTQPIKPIEPSMPPQKAGEAMFLTPKPQMPLTRELNQSWFGRRAVVAIGAAVILLGLAVSFVWWNASMTITVVPKRAEFDLGEKGIMLTVPAEELSSSLVKRGEGESLESKTFNEKARGTIIIFNKFSAASQSLVTNTRFETPEGKIYRLQKGVVVPGMSAGKPSSIEAVIIADQPGPSYNIGLTDFTIPGFKGSTKFEKFYGRSKTEMTGGASGEGKVIGAKEAQELLSKLEGEMLVELQKQFESTIPEGMRIFKDTIDYKTISKITDPTVGSKSDKFFAEVRGETKTLGIKEEIYQEMLAKALFKDGYRERAYRLDQNSSITIGTVVFDYQKKEVKIPLTGGAVFVGVIPTEELAQKTLALDEYEKLTDVFASYPGISKVEATFRPSFIKKIPSDPSRLKIEVGR
ncbi:MAG: hypothetical protein AAB372_03915 [Patescibacteria group bacterium]